MNTNMERVLETSRINHDFLIKKLNSNEGYDLLGLWIAVTRNKIFTSKSYDDVMNKALKIEPKKEMILFVNIPNKNMGSLRFNDE